MKAYLSFWAGGWQQFFTNFQSIDQYVINLHKICVYLAKKNFKEVHFLTDHKSEQFFKNIGFDSIEFIFDDLHIKYNAVWAISKLLAYKHICQKGDPFIHIDYDVLLWNGIPDRLQYADVFAQCTEDYSYHNYQVEKFLQNWPNTGLIGKINPKPQHAYNVGIFGGNNLDFISKYAQDGIDMVFDKQNDPFFCGSQIFDNHWNKSTIIEQYLLAVECQHYNIKAEMFFQNGWPSKEEARLKKYTHLLSAKQNPEVRRKIQLIRDHLEKKEIEQKEIEQKEIKKIVKIFGLPCSGTNLIEKILNHNIKDYVCQLSDYHPDYHYLGWKHGLPKNIENYDIIEKYTDEKVYFIFIIRNFEAWEKSYLNSHTNSWEHPEYFQNFKDGFLYNTPVGIEIYQNIEELYNTYTNKYKQFAEQNNDRAIVVYFDDLQKNQEEVFNCIINKFGLEKSHDIFYELRKKTDKSGRLINFLK